MFNLRNRSFLKEIDFEPRELKYLLQLAEALTVAKFAGNEVKRLEEGKEIALIFEKTSTRTRSAFEVAAFDQGPMSPTWTRRARNWAIRSRWRTRPECFGRMYDGIEFRGNNQDDVEELGKCAGVPVYNGLTDQWHPTQMLADFLMMHEASGKAYNSISYACVGDCRFNMGRSLLVMGALMGSDVRLAGPEALQPPGHVADRYRQGRSRPRTGARVTITDDAATAVSGVDFVHTDVWVCDGRGQGRLD